MKVLKFLDEKCPEKVDVAMKDAEGKLRIVDSNFQVGDVAMDISKEQTPPEGASNDNIPQIPTFGSFSKGENAFKESCSSGILEKTSCGKESQDYLPLHPPVKITSPSSKKKNDELISSPSECSKKLGKRPLDTSSPSCVRKNKNSRSTLEHISEETLDSACDGNSSLNSSPTHENTSTPSSHHHAIMCTLGGNNDPFTPAWNIRNNSLLNNPKEIRDFLGHLTPLGKRMEIAKQSLKESMERMDELHAGSVTQWNHVQNLMRSLAQDHLSLQDHLASVKGDYVKVEVYNAMEKELKETTKNLGETLKNLEESEKEKTKLSASLAETQLRWIASEERSQDFTARMNAKNESLIDVNKLLDKEKLKTKMLEEKIQLLNEQLALAIESKKEVISKVIPHAVNKLHSSPDFENPLNNLHEKAIAYGKHLASVFVKEKIPDVPDDVIPDYNPEARASLEEAGKTCEKEHYVYIDTLVKNSSLSVEDLLAIEP